MATETADYTVTLRDRTFEVRDYPAQLVAEVEVSGERDEAIGRGVRVLNGFLAGDNIKAHQRMDAPSTIIPRGQSATIAATMPVIEIEGARGWIVRFAMPRRYEIADLPRPSSPSVRIAVLPAHRAAAVRFSGKAQAHDFERYRGELLAFVRTQGLTVAGPVALARYDAGWTPGIFRRNEVIVPIVTADPVD